MIKACLHTHKEAQRDGAGGHITTCPVPPMPITGATNPPNAHVHMPEVHRGTTTGGNPNQGSPRNEGATSPGPSQGCPRRASALVSRLETHHKVSSGAALWISFWTVGVTAWGCRKQPYGMLGKNSLELHMTYCKMFMGGGTKGICQGFR